MKKISFLFFSIFVFSFFLNVLSVDRNKFIQCSQSGFCRRNRALEEGQSTHSVVSSSVKSENGVVSMELTNPNDAEKNFVIHLTGFENNEIVRVRISEKNPLRTRFDISQLVLEKELSKSHLNSIDSDNSRTKVNLANGRYLLIQHSPVKIDFFETNNESILSLNSKGLLNYEHFRTKESDFSKYGIRQQQHQQQEEEAEQRNEEDEREEEEEEGEKEERKQENSVSLPEGLWEESFQSHHDSKPFGPSSVGIDVTFYESQNVYGIPEHASRFSLPPTKGVSDPYRLYNLDVFEYELDNPMALYGSIPFMISHGLKRTNGFLWLNPSETWIDISKEQNSNSVTSHWFSEAGDIDIFFFSSEQPTHIFELYAKLTGTTPIPPMFSIAYHQCRWNYKDQQDVSMVDGGFDEHDIPYDVLWLDIEHTDGKKYFTWDPTHFPTPQEMQDDIAAKKRKMVTIVDPHIKRDGSYYVHQTAQERGYYVKSHNGQDYEGWCWPGSSSWLDYTDEKVRDYWADQFSYSNYKGSTNILFTWNDMNEPSVFNGPETTMPKDCKHVNDVEHREIHNAYGLLQHFSTAQGLIKRNPNKDQRPFVLSRAFFAGSQKSSAIWTGDNTAQWKHLEFSVPMLLSINVAGLTFAGADVGGFFGNPDGELVTRWYQAAAFQPFYRGHAHLDTKRREPWLFGEPYTSYIRTAIRRRYQLLPFFYTLFANSNRTGIPVMRPLWAHYPTDKWTFGIDKSHLVGSDLLVTPITEAGSTQIDVYLPGQGVKWYEYEGFESWTAPTKVSRYVALNEISVFQRGGSIIPRKERARRASYMMSHDPITLSIALDGSNSAKGELYVDDEISFAYKSGAYLQKQFEFSDNKLVSTNIHSDPILFSSPVVVEKVVIKGFSHRPNEIKLKIDSEERNLEFLFDYPAKTLTIRKPNALIQSEWEILIQ